MKAQNKKKNKVAEIFRHTEIALKPNGQQKWELILQEPVQEPAIIL
jgi:hypothetical protein